MANPPKCGVEIADFRYQGDRLGFLLVHRLGSTPAVLSYLATGLARAGRSVSCPLLYGHGGSRALLGATTWSQWYGTLVEAHQELSGSCDTVIVGGLGVGALLALNLAADHGARIDALALFAPTFWPNGWAMPWYGNVLRVLSSKRLANLIRFDERPPYGIKDDALRRSMLESLAQDGRSLDDVNGRVGGALLEAKWLARAVIPKLAQVTQPCLVFHPRYDDRSQLSASQLLQKQLGGIVELVVLEDSYHLVTLDRQRDLVLQRVIEFAEELPDLIRRGSRLAGMDDVPVP
jgi:carboxylesterase